MAYGVLKNIGVKGLICALPRNRVKTVEHTDKFELKVLERVVEQTGVKSTYRTKKTQTISDLCYEAGKELIEKLEWDKESIGALVLVTHAFDYKRPSTSSVIQKRLDLGKDCLTLDINLGCSGFVYGISVIGSLMMTSEIERAILLCGDLSSKAVDPDTTSNLLFGDIGAAIAFEKGTNYPDIHYLLCADGNRYKSIFARGGGFRHPDDNMYAEMEGMDVFAFSISDVPKAIKEFMEKYQMCFDKIDLFALHQANELIIRKIAKKVKAPLEKTPIILGKYGNSSSSSIPLVIADAFRNSERKEKHILMSGFGLGLSWGVADLYLPKEVYLDMIESNNYYDDKHDITVEE